jgi:hypothetical protein
MGQSFRPETVVFGLCLFALGLLWTLANLGRLELLPVLRTWWPVSLIVWGALELLRSWDRRGRAE